MKYIRVVTNNVPKQGKNMQVNLQRHGMDMLEVSDKKLSKSSKLPFWRFFKNLKLKVALYKVPLFCYLSVLKISCRAL